MRAAIYNSGLHYPRGHLTINLAPTDLRKEGLAYDLPSAVALPAVCGQLLEKLDHSPFLGELSLDSTVRHVNGVLPVAHLAREFAPYARVSCASPSSGPRCAIVPF